MKTDTELAGIHLWAMGCGGMLGAPGGQKQEDIPLGLQMPCGPALPGFQAAAPGWSTPCTLLYFCVTADAGTTPRAEGQLLAQNHQGAGWTGQRSPACLSVLNMEPCGRTSVDAQASQPQGVQSYV